jgi:DNA-binding transcriptional LysR family regulator
LRQYGIKPHQRCELDGLAAIATLVDRGLGVSLVPDWAPHEYAGISVRKWGLPNAAPKRLVGLMWGRSCARIRLVQAFLGAADQIERARDGHVTSTQ